MSDIIQTLWEIVRRFQYSFTRLGIFIWRRLKILEICDEEIGKIYEAHVRYQTFLHGLEGHKEEFFELRHSFQHEIMTWIDNLFILLTAFFTSSIETFKKKTKTYYSHFSFQDVYYYFRHLLLASGHTITEKNHHTLQSWNLSTHCTSTTSF